MQNELENMNAASVATVQKYHEQILTFLNTRLSETFKFYAPVLAALAGFGSSLASNAGPDILTPAYLTSLILLLGGIGYVFTAGYTYRNFQITLEQAEIYIGLSWLTDRWHITKKLDKPWWKNMLWLTPEILKPQLGLLVVTFFLITLVFFERPSTTPWFIDQTSTILLIGLLLPLMSMVLLDLHYYRKLRFDTALKKQIARRAYEIYEARGRQHGQDLEDWRKAKEEVEASFHVGLF